MGEQDYIQEDIILCNDGVLVTDLFHDDKEHFYCGKFYDGIAVLHKDKEDTDAPETVVMTYPTMNIVEGNADIAYEIRDYAGFGIEDDINYFDIALKYGKGYDPKIIGLQN